MQGMLKKLLLRFRTPPKPQTRPLCRNEPDAIAFLRGACGDHRGRFLDDILARDDSWLEEQHDFVQWLFPTATASDYNVFAPRLSEGALDALRTDLKAPEGLRKGYERMLVALALELDSTGAVRQRPQPTALAPAWMRPLDHNDLRITRILTCLHAVGMRDEHKSLLAFLESRFADVPYKAESLAYWRATSEH